MPLVLLAAGHLKNDGPATLARARARHPGRALPHGPRPRHRPARARQSPRTVPAPRSATPTPRTTAWCSSAAARATPTPRPTCTRSRACSPTAAAWAWSSPPSRASPSPTWPGALERCRRLGRAARSSVAPFLLFTGVLVPRIYAPGGRVGGRSTRTSRCAARAHLGPDRRLARLVLERYREALHRRRADELRPVRLPRAAAGLRGQGRDADLAHAARRRPRARRPARPPRHARPGAAARAGAAPPGLRPAPGRASARGHAAGARGQRACAYAYPDGTAALAGVDLTVTPGERRRRCSARTARARRRSRSQLNGVLEDGEGDVRVGGVELAPGARAREIRRRVGIVFQDPDDQLFMPTVEADVAFGPANQGLRGRGAARAGGRGARRGAARRRWPPRAPHRCRAGERRRAAVAGVLAMQPGRARARRADRRARPGGAARAGSTCSRRCA